MVSLRRRGWIGVDLGSRAVKLAQLERTARGLRVAEAVIVPRRPLRGAETAARDAAEEVAAAIALGTGFSGRAAAGMLSMGCCQTRLMHVSPAAPMLQREEVAEQLASQCGTDTEPREFDHWTTGTADDGTEAVTVISAPRARIEQAFTDLTDAGLRCWALDGLPWALARALTLTVSAEEQSPQAILDWGLGEATFCAVLGGVPVFTRRLRACGFGRVLQSAAAAAGIDWETIEARWASRAGLADAEVSPFDEAVARLAPDTLAVLGDELQRTLAFLGKSEPDAVPARLWLCGAGALWHGAADWLSSHAGLPVTPWRWENLALEPPHTRIVPGELLAPALALSALAWTNA